MRGFPRTCDCQRNRCRRDGRCSPAALNRWRTSHLAVLDPSSLDLAADLDHCRSGIGGILCSPDAALQNRARLRGRRNYSDPIGMGLRTIPLFGSARYHDLHGSAPPITIKLLAAALLVGSVLLLPSYRYLLAVFKDQDRGQFGYSDQHTNAQPRVVILGGGFGGLAAARALSHELVQITLVDRRNHHLFQSLLYQVATAALAPSDIALAIRRIMRGSRRVSVILDEATSIDVAGKRVVMRDSELEYDYLIVATGATHSYFGHHNWAEAAPGLKTLEHATEIRRRVLLAYEAAEREDDLQAQRCWLTFVIVGGGPTGVELAGALAEISHRVLSRDFRRIRSEGARIVLVEAASRVLPAMSVESSRNAERQLKRIGVELMLNTMVTGIDDAGVMNGRGKIASHTAIWAAESRRRRLDFRLERRPTRPGA